MGMVEGGGGGGREKKATRDSTRGAKMNVRLEPSQPCAWAWDSRCTDPGHASDRHETRFPTAVSDRGACLATNAY